MQASDCYDCQITNAEELLKRYEAGERHFQRAYLISANLQGATLEQANLSISEFYRADLRDANLRGTNLRRANLRAANLKGADLSDADLSGSIYNAFTRFPEHFDPIAAGMRTQ